MTTFILTRHGETIWHAENRYAGRSDIPLTPKGEQQGAGLARWAAGAGLTGIWSSTLGRAAQTARGSAEATGLELHLDPRLVELDFGQGEGLTAAEMHRQFPDALAAFREDPVASHLPGGEDPVLAIQRYHQVLQAISEEDPDGRVLLVAHSTMIRLVLCSYLSLPLAAYRRVFPALGNCSLTELRTGGDGAALLRYNAPALPAS